MSNFKATAQYNDFMGTAAADNADGEYDLDRFLEGKGLKKENEFLVGASLWVGSSAGGKLGHPSITAYLFDQADNQHDNVKAALEAMPDPIPVRTVEVEVSPEQFISFFKRFSVMLTRQSLNLDGREFNARE